MNGFAAFMGRTMRGVRLVEFAALLVMLVMALGVYLAKASAGRERADITQVQGQIDEEQKRLRLLQAEVAHLEEPERLESLSAQIGLGPTSARHQGAPDQLAQIASAGLLPDKGDKRPTVIAQAAPQTPGKTGAPQ
jgi:cell division protein FtsL